MDLKTIAGAVAPGLVARWYAKQAQLATAQRLYKAAAVTQYHPRRGDNRSANAVMEHARNNLSNWGRYLDENADLAVVNRSTNGVLQILVRTDRAAEAWQTVSGVRQRDADVLQTNQRR